MNKKNVFAFLLLWFLSMGNRCTVRSFMNERQKLRTQRKFNLLAWNFAHKIEHSAIKSFIISDQLCRNTIILLYNNVKFNKLERRRMEEVNSREKTILLSFVCVSDSYLQLYLIGHCLQYRCYHGFWFLQINK